MTEPNADDLKLRQMILDEWRSKTKVPDATKKINEKLGKEGVVSSSRVRYWFKRFDKGDTSIFNKNSVMYVTITNASKDPSNSLILMTDDDRLSGTMLTKNGRLVFFPNCKSKRLLIIYDLFHGVKKEIQSDFGCGKEAIALVSDYLLEISSDKPELCVSRINYDNLTIDALDSIDLDEKCDMGEIFADQLGNNKFLIQDGSYIAIGEIKNDRVELDDIKEVNVFNLHGQRMLGNKYQGLTFDDGLSTMRFCEVDLTTLEKKQTKAPLILDGNAQILGCREQLYCWSGNRYYGIYFMNTEQEKVLVLNLDTFMWSDINILIKFPSNMFVDFEHNLTLQVAPFNKNSTFYRFALKKPDCLKNLAWLVILRYSKVFRGEIYDKIADRLPYNCDLRCWIPNENTEKSDIDE